MNKRVIIEEILKRFKLDSNAIKKMERYEYDLIYRAFSGVPPEVIDEAIESYKRSDFKVKVVKTTYH